MATALLTPVNKTASRTKGGAWRKQILPFRTINYAGRQIKFDRKYMQDLVNSFKSGAYDQVPLQFADAKNAHTNDPERTRGHLMDLELAEDGLYGVFELAEQGAQVIDTNPRLGVSARILNDYIRPDGKQFPAAIQHVLATVDPKMTGLRPWERVDLSNDTVTEVIDLSMEAEMPKKNDDGTVFVVELSQSDLEVLQQVLADQKAVVALANEEAGEDDEVEDSEVDRTDPETDPETEEDDEEPENEEGPQPPPAPSTKAKATEAALSNAVDDVARGQVVELTNQLRDSEVERELDRLRSLGLAPVIIDLAQPVLKLEPQAIELSNGETVDPGKVMRDVLHEVVELASSGHAMVDTDVESGILVGSDSVQQRRQAQLEAWNNEQF